jgi:hypothetical protein
VQLVTSPTPSARSSGGGSAVPVLNPAAPNFNAGRLSAEMTTPQSQHQLLPPSSRAHLWHEMSGKVVQHQHQYQHQHQQQQQQQQQQRWN